MRRLTRTLALAVACLAGGCAQPGAPPGGPPDDAAPALLRVSPDTNATGVRPRALTLVFDEILREGPAEGQGSLESLLIVSPDRGGLRTRWRRERLEVTPEGGFLPNTTYAITLLPGLTDLRGNRDSTTRTFVFSTGPALDSGVVRGILFDWPAERPASAAMVEAVVVPERPVRDTMRYLTVTDSVGRFALRYLPAGTVLLRGFIDQNRSRTLEPREPFDSVTVAVGRDTVPRELLAFVHDTIGPGISNVTFADSLNLRVAFDRPIDPGTPLTTEMFTLTARDSSVVAITRVLAGPAYERLLADSARARAVRDSIERVRRADSVRLADTTRAAQPPAPTPPRQARPTRPAPPPSAAAPRDSTPRPSRPKPATDVVLTLASPLPPNQQFRLRVVGVRNLLGATRPVDRTFTSPRPAARDTTARPDTGAAAPARRPPRE